MKKTLPVILAFIAVSSVNAASIDWSITGKGTASGYDSASLSSTVYFILADDVSGLTGHESETDFLAALTEIKLDDHYSASGGAKPAGSADYYTVTDSKITGNQQTFGMLVYDTDSDGNGWYKIVTTPGTGYTTGASADSHTFADTSWSTMRNSDWVSAWTKQDDPGPGPQPDVPEPATGALALAGVALLFKRRRA